MSTDQVIDKWTRETEKYKDISVTLEQGSTTSSSMSNTNQIEVDLQSTDYNALKQASDEPVSYTHLDVYKRQRQRITL